METKGIDLERRIRRSSMFKQRIESITEQTARNIADILKKAAENEQITFYKSPKEPFDCGELMCELGFLSKIAPQRFLILHAGMNYYRRLERMGYYT